MGRPSAVKPQGTLAAGWSVRLNGYENGVQAAKSSSSTFAGARRLAGNAGTGAHLYPHWFELPPDHAKYYPYYAKCCELDIPIMMQVGQNLIYQRDRRLPSVARPITLDRVAIDFPDLKLLGIHIGVPWVDEMIAMAWKHENVFIGVDDAPKHWQPQLVHYLNTYGKYKFCSAPIGR
jgi:predicted TIM-barrel fold metal-dependent hydrolase